VAYKEIIIHPEPVGDLKSAKAEFASPYGNIESNWTKKDGNFELSVHIPSNTSAN